MEAPGKSAVLQNRMLSSPPLSSSYAGLHSLKSMARSRKTPCLNEIDYSWIRGSHVKSIWADVTLVSSWLWGNPQMLRPLIRFTSADWHLHRLLVCRRGDPKGSDLLWSKTQSRTVPDANFSLFGHFDTWPFTLTEEAEEQKNKQEIG